MTATVHATPADRLAGRINRYIADLCRCPDAAVLPHARLREDLKAGPLDLQRLAWTIEVDLGLEPLMFERPEDRFLTVADVHAHYAGRAGRAA